MQQTRTATHEDITVNNEEITAKQRNNCQT
jgi:hypothetical protein